MRSLIGIVGCAALNASTAFLHPAGMDVLTVGLFPCVAAEAASLGAFAGITPLRNFASGHVSIMSMVQSSTSLRLDGSLARLHDSLRLDDSPVPRLNGQ